MSNADGIKVNKTEQKSVAKKEGSPVATYAIIAVVVALVVGGAIYAWQKKQLKDETLKIKKTAVEEKSTLEKRIDSLKEKISGIESENEKLKNASTELDAKSKLLASAVQIYSDKDLKFSFAYPALFEEVKITKDDKMFAGNFSKNEKVNFGGAGENYVSASSTDILRVQGYLEADKKYYLRVDSEKEKEKDIEIKPIKIINTGKGKVLLVDKKSFVDKDGKIVDVMLGENIAALVNLGADKFKGTAIVNSDFGAMSVERFEEMIKSLK